MVKGAGDHRAIFGKAKITTKQKSCDSITGITTYHSESIVHRLNHLSLLINSSGIDLNIALNESDFQSSECSFAANGDRNSLDHSDPANKLQNPVIASLASQSTRRRSLLPPPNKVSPESLLNSSFKANNSANVSSLARASCSGSSTNGGNNPVSYIGKDGLLDAFLALYEECSTDEIYKKDSLIQEFVKKYQPYAAHLTRLRVSLADFDCLRVIGRGHFGVVQLVKEKATEHVYALKTLRKDDMLHQKHVAFYEEERDIQAKASSPWITKLQYAFQDAHHLHLVMEYHPGGDLLSLLERQHPRRCLPESWAVFYLAQTATALHHLHGMGYTHRDVKPENLLLDRCGHIKLADFGSSCRVTNAGLVVARLPAGTPDYVAPEVLAAVDTTEAGASDGGGGYGVSCDFWSLGIVAYEMLYSQTPFASEKMINTYSNIMQHKSKLEFPTDHEVSAEAISLVRGLVCNAEDRLDYQAITQHRFFLHTDWNGLHNMVPPFLPVVSGPDDTSNFDNFEDSEAAPEGGHRRHNPGAANSSIDLAGFRGAATGLGRRLPFVGFTYARPPLGDTSQNPDALNASKLGLEESLKHDTTQLIGKLESELLQKKKELHDMQMKANEKSSRSSTEQTKLEAEHAKSKAQLLERDRDRIKQQLKAKEANIAALKQQLTSERSERAATESKTLSLIRDIKLKWKKEEEAKLAELHDKCEIYKSSAESERSAQVEMQQKLQETLHELSELQRQALHYRKLEHQKEKEMRKLQETIGILEEQVKSSSQRLEASSNLETSHILTKSTEHNQSSVLDASGELERTRRELRFVTEERNKLNESVRELEKDCETITALERELVRLKSQLDEMEANEYEEMEKLTRMHDQVIAAKEALISELKVNVQQERREKTLLTTKLQAVTADLAEAQDKLSLLEGQLLALKESRDEGVVTLKKQLDESSHTIKDRDRMLAESKSREDDYKSKINQLESILNKLESTVHHLEHQQQKQHEQLQSRPPPSRVGCEGGGGMVSSEVHLADLKSRSEAHRAELHRVMGQLGTAREDVVRLEEKNKTLATDLEKERDEVSRLKLDARLAEREAKAAQEKITFLRECNRETRELTKQQQTSLQEHEAEREKLNLQIGSLQDELEAAKQSLLDQQKLQLTAAGGFEVRIAELEEGSKAKKELNNKLLDALAELDKLKVVRRGAESSLEQSRQETRAAEQAAEEVRQQMRLQDEVVSKLRQEITVLKDLCTEQDQQLTELDALEGKMQEHARERSKLQEEISKLQIEVKSARAQANEEKSLKAFQERQVKSLQGQLRVQEQQQDTHTAGLQKEMEECVMENVRLGEKQSIQSNLGHLISEIELSELENKISKLEMSELEMQLSDGDSQLRSLQEREAALHAKLSLLKEESAGHITHIHGLKESNFQLTQGLEEALDKAQLYKKRVEELVQQLAEEKQVAGDRDLRSKMTIEQQTKLIDFLQTKLDDKMKKKKTLSSKLFGVKDKENIGSGSGGLTPYRTRSQLPDVRSEILAKSGETPTPKRTSNSCVMAPSHPSSVPTENCKLLKTPPKTTCPRTPAFNKKLSSASFKTPSNSKTPAVSQFKTSDTAKVSSSSSREGRTPLQPQTPCSESKSATTSRQRMRHNIPHRFERSMIVQGGRCAGCLSSLPRGRFAYRCAHCQATAHKHCCPGVPATCGLPLQLAGQFGAAAGSEGSPSAGVEGRDGAVMVHEGWVKMPRSAKACWEFCFARLLSSGDVLIFDHEPSECTGPDSPDLKPRCTVNLKVDSSRVEVVSTVPRSEIPATSSVDLPYVLKVDVLRGYQQSVERLYFMTTNFEQKQRWVAALEHTLCQGFDSVSCSGDTGSSIDVQCVLQLSPAPGGAAIPSAQPHTPHSLIFVDQKTALLGCSEGLFSLGMLSEGALSRRARLGALTDVHQLLDVPSIEHFAVIAGPTRGVFLLPHRSTLSAARLFNVDEPSLPLVEVTVAAPCHLLAAGATAAGKTFVCAAAEDRISILVWDAASSELQLARQFGTQETCTSCLFTPASLIVSANKLYEIDLNTFTIEEFLDESDTSLAYAIYGTAQMASFPLAVLQISESGKYGEFLICFNEFALFVDPYGRRSREHDIKFNRIPVDVAYVRGSLFLVHSNSVEVIQIRSDSFTRVTSSEAAASAEFDTSSSLSPACHIASRSIACPHLIGILDSARPARGASDTPIGCVLVSCAGEEDGGGVDVLQLMGVFPEDDLCATWPSLPSAITASTERVCDDNASLSSGSYSIGDAEQQRSDKRKPEPRHVQFTVKRSRKDGH